MKTSIMGSVKVQLPEVSHFSPRGPKLLGRALSQPAENLEPGPNSWRGQGGGVSTLDSVQFDRQMDKISLWVEEWDHNTVSEILTTFATNS